MKSHTHNVSALLVLVLALVTMPARAHADTYQSYDLGPDMTNAGTTSVFGITDSGTVVLVEDFHVGVPQCAIQHICTEYETWVNGIMVTESPTAPNLVYDDGTPCTPTTTFPVDSFGFAFCNNGHELYYASTTSLPSGGATFYGPDITDVLAYPPLSADELNINASGDFTYDISHPTAVSGEIFERIDLSTTPEPGSLFLLATGSLAAATFRRRIFQS